jgi:hypothetical protein
MTSLLDYELHDLCREQFLSYDTKSYLPFIFSRSKYGKYSSITPRTYDLYTSPDTYKYCTDDINGIEAINIDTGSVYGGALTALGLSSRYLSDKLMPLLSYDSSSSQRSNRDKFHLRLIAFDSLGRFTTRTDSPA